MVTARSTGEGRAGPVAHSGAVTYSAPRRCPVCGDDLVLTRLGCLSCGTELAGSFEGCEFCAVSSEDRELLRIFLASRGNMKELERHLGVSYPTARGRFDALLGRLGLTPTPGAAVATDDFGPQAAAGSTHVGEGSAAVERLEVLQRLARGDIDLAAAEAALEGRPSTSAERGASAGETDQGDDPDPGRSDDDSGDKAAP